MHWNHIEAFGEALNLATRLDPTSSLPPDLGLYLRLNVLLWDRLLIPEVSLMHNAALEETLNQEDGSVRSDFEEFLAVASPIITRNDRPYNDSFEGHWEASRETKNPLLIPGRRGFDHARYLDRVISREQCRTYTSRDPIRNFEELFREALRNAFTDLNLRDASLPALLRFIEDPANSGGDLAGRAKHDGFFGLTRGGVLMAIRQMSREPSMLPHRAYVRAAAQQAYSKNVLDSLNRDVKNFAQLPLISRGQLTGEAGYRMKLDSGLGDDLLQGLLASRRVYAIDPQSLRDASWELIAQLSKHEARLAFHLSRSAALRAELEGDQIGYCTAVAKMVQHLDSYLLVVADRLRGKGALRLAMSEFCLTPARAGGALVNCGVSLYFGGPVTGTIAFALLESLGFWFAGKRRQALEVERRSQLRDFLVH